MASWTAADKQIFSFYSIIFTSKITFFFCDNFTHIKNHSRISIFYPFLCQKKFSFISHRRTLKIPSYESDYPLTKIIFFTTKKCSIYSARHHDSLNYVFARRHFTNYYRRLEMCAFFIGRLALRWDARATVRGFSWRMRKGWVREGRNLTLCVLVLKDFF